MRSENAARTDLVTEESLSSVTMVALSWLLLTVLSLPFRSMSRLEAENAALCHQLAVLRRKVPGRVQLTNSDRLFLIHLYDRRRPAFAPNPRVVCRLLQPGTHSPGAPERYAIMSISRAVRANRCHQYTRI